MFMGNDKVYQIRFVANERGEYDKVFHVAEKIIDSLEVNAYNFTYNIPKYGVAIQYPYSWTDANETGSKQAITIPTLQELFFSLRLRKWVLQQDIVIPTLQELVVVYSLQLKDLIILTRFIEF